MKILQLLHRPERRGAEVFARQLSDELERQGCVVACVYLYAFEDPTALPLRAHDAIVGGRLGNPFDRSIGFDPILRRGLRRVIARFDPDVVQANGGRTLKYGALARRTRDRWALIYRNIGDPTDWVEGRRRWFYRRFVMPQFDGIVGVSDITLSRLRDLYDLEAMTAQISTAVDTETFAPTRPRADVRKAFDTPLDAPVILYAGSLTPEKRPDLTVNVFRSVVAWLDDTYLWVLGSGPLRGDVERALVASGLSSQSRVLGPRRDVADVMAAADILLLPSDTEGIPAVVLEAAAVATPAVATRVGGLAECVRDGFTGLLVERGDAGALARAVTDLLDDPTRRENMGQAAKSFVFESFGLRDIAEQYLAFYEQVRDARKQLMSKEHA